jgi:HSP20 family protein
MSFAPQMDVKDQNGEYIVRFDIPGADKSKITVNVDDRQLTVKGSTDETIEKKDGDRVLRQERRSGQFERSITLPGPVEADKITARYENGVLVVTAPKAGQTPNNTTIKVQ